MKTFAKGQVKPPASPTIGPALTDDDYRNFVVAVSQAPQYDSSTKRTTAKGPSTALEYESIDLSARYQEPFALAIYGPQGSGKTRLGASAPGTIGVVPLNRKTRQTVVNTAKELGKRIVMPKFDLVRSSNPMKAALLKPNCEAKIHVDITRDQPWCCAVHNGRWAVDRAKQCAFDHVERADVDSVFVDGFDIFCDDMLIAHYGRSERIQPRDRGPYNKEMIEFLGALSSKHLVLTMGQKEVWKNEKPTGTFDWSGWTHLGYHCNTVVHMTVQENYDQSKHEDRWALNVILCQANPALMGVAGVKLLTDDFISFPLLASKIYEGTEVEEWE